MTEEHGGPSIVLWVGGPVQATVWCDTRQQKGKHTNIDRWFDSHGVEYEYRKLDYGDYMREGSNISVDTKKDIQEVAGNVGRDHARFVRECERAAEAGYHLVILVEGVADGGKALRAGEWVSGVCKRCHKCKPELTKGCRRYGRKPLQGKALASIIAGIEDNHGVEFRFCRRDQTAKVICEILGVKHE